LQILAKQIIVDPHDEIIEHELNSPFVYLRSVGDDLFTPDAREGCGSEHVPLGTYKSDKASQNSEYVEEFVAGLRFEQRGKLDIVPINHD
jgi:hypothetical protein